MLFLWRGRWNCIPSWYFYCLQVLENSRINQNVILQKIWRFHRKNYRLLFFDFLKKDNMENETLYNRFFLIFKSYVYRSREKRSLSVKSLVDQIMKIKLKKNRKRKLTLFWKKRAKYNKKQIWSLLSSIFKQHKWLLKQKAIW